MVPKFQDRQDLKTVVDLIEDWQTSFFLVLACLVVTIVRTILVSPTTPHFGVVLFLASGILTFLLLSSLLYGR